MFVGIVQILGVVVPKATVQDKHSRWQEIREEGAGIMIQVMHADSVQQYMAGLWYSVVLTEISELEPGWIIVSTMTDQAF